MSREGSGSQGREKDVSLFTAYHLAIELRELI